MLRALFVLFTIFVFAPCAHAAEDALTVELDKGKLIQLNSDIRSVFVANPDIADVQMMAANSLMVFGKRSGETTLIVVDEHNRPLLNRRIVVEQNLGTLREMLKALVPNTAIDAAAIPGGIVLSGDVRTPAEAENARSIAEKFLPAGGTVLNRLSVTGPTQVMLQVRVAEMLRTVDKSFGFNWDAQNSGGQGFSFARGNSFFNPDNRYALVDPFSFLPLGDLVRPTGKDVLFGRLATGQWAINAMLDTMEDEGLVTILAEPSLTALSGETASFLAGGEFPVPVPSDNGIQIEYKSYGVSLSFTPTLLDHNRINLRVRPEVSQLSSANQVTIENSDIPSLITRRTDTTIEVGSGQSFAIAGLLQNNTNQDTSKFPFLGDLPVLGALFKSEAFTREESELVIIVTPYIVRPTNERLATPVDNYDVPGDGSRILLDEKVNEVPAAPFARLVDQPLSFFVE